MEKKIPSRTRLALSAAILIARNKHARHLITRNKHTRALAVRTGRSIMRHPQTRRAALLATKQGNRSSGRPLMIGVASVGVISAAGAAVFARSKRGGTSESADKTTE